MKKKSTTFPADGQARVVVVYTQPSIQEGTYSVKTVAGDPFPVRALLLADGHDRIAARVCLRRVDGKAPIYVPMQDQGGGHWSAEVCPTQIGAWTYTVEAWIDQAASWLYDTRRKIEGWQRVHVELKAGQILLEKLIPLVQGSDKKQLKQWLTCLGNELFESKAIELVQSPELADFIGRYPNPEWVRRGREMPLWVDRERAVFGAWYELFPRSTSPDPNRAGTFRDTINLLPRLQELGMNVLYLPPIHPIGVQHRKGRNNSTTAMPGEPGCPWAIGGLEGGHRSLHPELGGWSDFRALVEAAKGHGMELALDYALQCSPDHPYVREHPQWFRWRPDGTIQYAENPPKKYQDVLPLNFESSDWQALWQELLDVLLFWINEGIHIFRVDNPHTKSFHFWSWCIGEVHRKHPEVLFLSEAFTDPERMKELARIGFTQSYTYFTWRNHKQELQAYVEELTQTEMKHYFRPNFWPNTPDINPIPLQGAPEALFMTRLFMAATLSSTYGMYGPVYEFALSAPMEGKEEYIDSEKYEVRHWDWSHRNRITELLRRLNKARLLHPALQRTANIRFCAVDSDELMAYVKRTADRSDRILAVVNLNPHESRQGMVRLDLDDLQLPHDQPFVAHDLLTDERYAWRGPLNFVALHPGLWPVHLLHLSTI